MKPAALLSLALLVAGSVPFVGPKSIGLGGAEMLYCFSQVSSLALWHWLLLPAALLFTNAGEYVAHRELQKDLAALCYALHTTALK